MGWHYFCVLTHPRQSTFWLDEILPSGCSISRMSCFTFHAVPRLEKLPFIFSARIPIGMKHRCSCSLTAYSGRVMQDAAGHQNGQVQQNIARCGFQYGNLHVGQRRGADEAGGISNCAHGGTRGCMLSATGPAGGRLPQPSEAPFNRALQLLCTWSREDINRQPPTLELGTKRSIPSLSP